LPHAGRFAGTLPERAFRFSPRLHTRVFDFSNYSLTLLAAAFAVAAALVWGAGTRIARYLDRIADKTGMGAGLVGLLLLGGITSLPEVATVTTASYTGNASLAVNNVLGSASINVVLLAVADAFLGQRALSSTVGTPTPLLQAVLSIVLLTLVVMGIATTVVAVFGVGLWAWALVPLFSFAVWLTAKYQHHRPWSVSGQSEGRKRERRERRGQENAKRAQRSAEGGSANAQSAAGDDDEADQPGGSLRSDVIKTLIAALVILAAGYVLARTGDAVATKTGIGSNLIGLVLVGFATSLPEISSIYAAVKLQRYSMVMGDIFGTNIFNVVLIFLADAIYSGTPVLTQAGTFEIVATLLAILLTAIYTVGLLERQDRTLGRIGYPSLAILVTYAAGLVLLWLVRGSDA
jgi:cation:H+ antiporter